MTAIVLSGGPSGIVNELYRDLHPALVPVAEQPFLYWLTQWIKQQGFKQIVFSAGVQAEKLAPWITQQSVSERDVCFDILTESRSLGTGGASLMAAQRFPCDVFMVVNGDSLLLTDLNPYIEKLKSSPTLDGILVGVNLENAGRFGNLIINQSDQLVDFQEKQPGKGLINAGVYLFKQSLFDGLESDKELSLEFDCFPAWLKAGKCFEVVTAKGPFIDVGTTESLNKAQELILPFKQELAPTLM